MRLIVHLRRPDQHAPRADAASRGAANAPVVIQVFSDFQCPACQALEQVYAASEATWTRLLAAAGVPVARGTVIERTAAVRWLKMRSTLSPQAIRISPDGKLHTKGNRVEIEVGGAVSGPALDVIIGDVVHQEIVHEFSSIECGA